MLRADYYGFDRFFYSKNKFLQSFADMLIRIYLKCFDIFRQCSFFV